MTRLFKIALPDGSVREMPEGSTPADVAAAIGPGLAKAALAARIDGEVRDLNRPFEGDGSLALITSRDEKDALELVRHDFAHVLAHFRGNAFQAKCLIQLFFLRERDPFGFTDGCVSLEGYSFLFREARDALDMRAASGRAP